MSIKTIRGLEAGIRIGESALKAGLVDRIDDGSQPLGGGTDNRDAKASPKERSSMDKEISLALGCAEDATEAAVLASATKIVGERDALFALLGAESVDEAKGAVKAMRADKAALEAANAKLAEVAAAQVAKEREDLLASASKLFSPAKMECLKEESVDFIRKFVSMATPDIRLGSQEAAEVKVGRVLNSAQKRAAESAGMTEEEFAAELDRIDDGGAQ
jgi:septum formation topological specificity factor MinE